MADIVLKACITVVVKLITSELLDGDISTGIDNQLKKLEKSFRAVDLSKGIDTQLKKLEKSLPMIHAVVADAVGRQITDRAVQLWLNDLQILAYDIEDVLDDLATEVLRHKLNQESHSITGIGTSKFKKFLPTFTKSVPPSDPHMSSKVDAISTKLDVLFKKKNDLGLNVTVDRSVRTKSPMDLFSWVDDEQIMGREGDKEALLGKLLGNDERLSIVSLVGMGGIGKTALAKALCNDQKVKEHFELSAWVCVSEEFDVFNITKAIFQAVTGVNKDFASLDLLHEALGEKLSKKRFLLVLDDVWNEDHSKWELLLSPLLLGAHGSTVLVTTRSTRCNPSVIGSNETYHLEVLSNEDALSLFAQHALGEKNFDKHPTLQSHGQAIVKKCGGLPLALRMLGRVLRTRGKGDEWEKLFNNEIWDMENGSEILPALRLSYHHLPPHLKLLFAYCSLFPKDYMFDKKKLVLMWMAEGFLSQSNGNTSMERLGDEYFESLKSSSFFLHSKNDEGHTMHGLISDLATSVAGEFFLRYDDEMDVSNTNVNFENLRYFSLTGPQGGSYRKLKEFQRSRCLRTFLLMSFGWKRNHLLDNFLVELLLELPVLRVLSLSSWRITKIPQSIGVLTHLRYLNFSNTRITCLPEQVSDLYNLQSLLVSGCYELSGLPESFFKLINLRHFDISRTPKLNKMPSGIGRLTSLQTLPKVIIGVSNGFKISELKDLSDLQGRLSIMGLDKVINPMQAKDANLHQKTGLDVLDMEWSDVFDDSRNGMVEYQVLEQLRPHHNLRNLKILFYKGMRFPGWVGDRSFDQLTELTFCGGRSTSLPTLGCLPSLGKLFIKRMNEVETVGFELLAPTDSASSCDIAFPSLQVLKFDDMQHWKRWSTSGGKDNGTARHFPRLREISIKRCPRLAQVSIESIPSLQVLHIEGCSQVVLRSIVGASSSLVALKLWNVKGLTQLHVEDLMHLKAVDDLYIDGCDELRCLWESESEACKILRSLQKLEVRNCDTLESLDCPIRVEKLVISCCGSMTSLTFSKVLELPSSSVTESIISDSDNIEPAPEKGSGILSISCLRSIDINGCKNLKSFPHEHLQSLTPLEHLWIHDCPSMDYSFPCGLWPPNLSSLGIGYLNKPMSQWGPQNFPTSLVELLLYGKKSGVVSFAVAEHAKNTTTSSAFLLPPSLASLGLVGFMDVESLSEVLRHLPCLKRLDIWSCPKIRDLPETTSNPSSLTVKVWQ